jgi:hypothetical protein
MVIIKNIIKNTNDKNTNDHITSALCFNIPITKAKSLTALE